jgi:hypothetical protein
MDTIRFPTAVGNDVHRAIAIIRDRIGYDTKVSFSVVEHKGPIQQAVRADRLVPNVVILHLDTKWNGICRTPVFYGVCHTETESQHGDVEWEGGWESE